MDLVYTDYAGHPFCAPVEEKSSVTNIKFDYTEVKSDNGSVSINGDNTGDINTGDQSVQIIDASESTYTGVKLEVGDPQIDLGGYHYHNEHLIEAIWNGDLNQYEVTTGDIVYNNDNRTFNTVENYYTITYNITNTYINYIGSSAQFVPTEYELYYELPDGRSSADLTAEEVAALSFQFEDVRNYQRSATDTNIKALYHFDGDLSDSSYYSDQTQFSWSKGASITYMDSSTFDGALYLDETAHDFTITLPTRFNAGNDFTIQFRYYQASEPDTQDNIDNALYLGSTPLLRWDERYLYDSIKSSLGCALPIGNWAELALVRHNGTLYTYVNGICVADTSSLGPLSGDLRFSLGADSRAYSMLDELRVLDFAVAENGNSYTPTAVPHDSNLVLTLPDGTELIKDEWFEVVGGGQYLDNHDFTHPALDLGSSWTAYGNNVGLWVDGSGGTTGYSIFQEDGYISLSKSGSFTYSLGQPPRGFYCLLGQKGINGVNSTVTITGFTGFSSSSGRTMGLKVIEANGRQAVFQFNEKTSGITLSSVITSEMASGSGSDVLPYTVAYQIDPASQYDRQAALFIVPKTGYTVDLLAADIFEWNDSESAPSLVKHAATYSPSDLVANSAAVHTDIPITGYTVGGVRPTFPERGNVWFGVTGRRVSSVQVYTGSAWTSADARWWTGSRWIPIYAFDIYTLEDCWDIADADDVITPIVSDTEGWNWWKGAWYDFRSWFKDAIGSIGSGSGSTTTTPEAPAVQTTFTLWAKDQLDNPDIEKRVNDLTSQGYKVDTQYNYVSSEVVYGPYYGPWAEGLSARMGTSNYFTVNYSKKSKVGRLGDGLGWSYVYGTPNGSRTFSLGGSIGDQHTGEFQNSIQFTTLNPGTVTVCFQYDGTGPIDLVDSKGVRVSSSTGSEVPDSAPRFMCATLDIPAAGTYYLGCVQGYKDILRVDVTEYGPHPMTVIDVDATQEKETVLRSHTLLSSEQTKHPEVKERLDAGKGSGLVVQMGTADYFTVRYDSKSKLDYSAKKWSDGFTTNERFARFNFGTELDARHGGPGIEFTTEGPAVVKVWWVPGGDGRYIWVKDSLAHKAYSAGGDGFKKNEPYISEIELPYAGTWYLGPKDGYKNSYIFKVVVTERVPKADPVTIGSNLGDNYDDGEPDILEDPLEDENGEKVSAFSLFGMLGKGLWKLVKGLFNGVLGGVGEFLEVTTDGMDDFFDAFDSGPGSQGVFGFYTYEGDDLWD